MILPPRPTSIPPEYPYYPPLPPYRPRAESPPPYVPRRYVSESLAEIYAVSFSEEGYEFGCVIFLQTIRDCVRSWFRRR